MKRLTTAGLYHLTDYLIRYSEVTKRVSGTAPLRMALADALRSVRRAHSRQGGLISKHSRPVRHTVARV